MHIAQQIPLPLTLSYSIKSRLVLTFLVLPFWYLLTRVVPDIFQKSSKTVVCVCVIRLSTTSYSHSYVESGMKSGYLLTYGTRPSLPSLKRGTGLTEVITAEFDFCLVPARYLPDYYRLYPVAEQILAESQCGFRPSRGTVDMIFSARQLQEKCIEQQKPLFMTFFDLSKAFDSVDRSCLWEIPSRYGCPPNFINIIRLFHDCYCSC